VKKFTEASSTITIHLKDDHELQDTNLDALVSDTFVKAQTIKSAKIEGRNRLGPDLVHSISVNLEVDLLHVVQVTIAGDRDRSLVARRELDTILYGAEYWYAPLFLPRSLVFFQLSIFLPIVLAAAIAAFLTWLFGGEVSQKSITAWALLPFAALTGAYFGLKDYLFPKLTFDIGRSANRIQSARYWRNILLTSIIIGIIGKLAIDRLLK
jgi:hypothetical protein